MNRILVAATAALLATTADAQDRGPLSKNSSPPLIVVECMKDPQTLLWEVDQLAEVCDAGTKVVVVGATTDILLFRELMRRGVSEYLVAPLQPMQLIGAIGGLFCSPEWMYTLVVFSGTIMACHSSSQFSGQRQRYGLLCGHNDLLASKQRST